MLITLYKSESESRLFYFSIHNRQGSLFAKYTLTTNWGRALSAGRERLYFFDNKAEQDEKLRELLQRRLSDGYRVLYSYFKNSEYASLGKALSQTVAS